MFGFAEPAIGGTETACEVAKQTRNVGVHKTMNTKATMAVCLVYLCLPGCRKETPPEPPSTQPAGSIGPQFQAYELPEYSLQGKDIVYGLGGRWITLRYVLKPEATCTPAEIRNRIKTALEREGWQQKPLPNRKYVLSKIYETASNDLYYTHGAFEGDPNHWFYNQAVHVSDDGRTVVCYYEVGW